MRSCVHRWQHEGVAVHGDAKGEFRYATRKIVSHTAQFEPRALVIRTQHRYGRTRDTAVSIRTVLELISWVKRTVKASLAAFQEKSSFSAIPLSPPAPYRWRRIRKRFSSGLSHFLTLVGVSLKTK